MINMNWWNELDPNKKRWVAVAGGVFVLFVAVSLFSDEGTSDSSNKSRKETIRHVLTDKGTREAGMDALVGNLKTTKAEQEQLRRELDRVKRELEDTKSKAGASVDIGKELDQLKRDVKELSQENRNLARDLEKAQKDAEKRSGKPTAGGAETGSTEEQGAQQAGGYTSTEKLDYKDPNEFFKKAPLPADSHSKPTGKESDRSGKPTAQPGIRIVNYTEYNEAEEKAAEEQEDQDNSIYLPAGSILTGVTITGMDAPTAKGARKDPFPATIRLQKEAILPNRFRADVRECFLIVSGYGDLSSERAYLRGEVISCVREDGGVIESRLDGYAVGEDGKAGVRGRLVSKQGAMIAKSLTAGFLSGFAQALDTNPVPVINTNPTDTPVYQQVFNENTLQSGISKGASSAMEKVAQFYLDMAEGMFPVIEVDAGRQIDVIITKGQQLKLKSQGTK
ncbi:MULTISPECIES: TrbI/VirB10 family protein [Vibrio]|nr:MULTISPECIES: TrbI/VirB10 family protein [Vibrio]HCJ6891809.1 conjugal transfer protein TraB [Vibrio cholerae]EGR2699487.1 conjugal transfer protein TraB [Vibrio parahaemolyticus]EGR3255668.1 conjugal transfer protein TraB [Vibrio parahaemolyticus]EHH1074850.1 conjugal transfer protein TraB [Vibrio parahaemolyticus]EHR0228430.1 conjugal transfer protein TraB [Vibrio parahaemolyticus]